MTMQIEMILDESRNELYVPDRLTEDIRKYVVRCVECNQTPDTFSFALMHADIHGDVAGKVINEIIAKELAEYERK
ncbi:hypothetical protein NQ117_05465 [Paenibacillus sp. SC116]|uniref:hypothetical protein n=1 Tax=Paenibacillus sp. SC116 TaxID=2968986 RepID=UPI00215AB315|nr:hypothetical protein [Paenibacillus sp. SC116]MCR8843121.1 hypothetical protein [Paenibacillus sp. SC116]